MDKFFAYIDSTEYTTANLKESLAEKLPAITPQDLTGKVVVVTGANAGIGYEAAKAVASMKPKLLIMACRNAEKAGEAVRTIKEATGCANIEVATLDLASYQSTKNFAHDFLKRGLPLDIFVSNAGVAGREWVQTADGDEITIQVNHLSNMLLTLLLTPALAKSGSGRVVVVASDVHFWAQRPAPEDPTPIKTALTQPDQLFMQQYTTSKLFNVLFVQEYARRCPHKNITICATNPSYTQSELGAKDPLTGNPIEAHAPHGLEKRTTYEGAKTIIDAAIAPTVKNGAYYSEMRPERTRTTVQGETGVKFAANVWKDSIAHLQKQLKDEQVEAWATK